MSFALYATFFSLCVGGMLLNCERAREECPRWNLRAVSRFGLQAFYAAAFITYFAIGPR